MRFPAACLRALERSTATRIRTYASAAASPALARAKSISFLGLGRMGSEMAFNLFSKQFALSENKDASFVVCDAVPEAARAFADNFRKHFPGADVRVVSTPEEYVCLAFLFALFISDGVLFAVLFPAV